MKEQWRTYPQFAACGLNCALCPMYHRDDGKPGCPGCGGPGHATCVMTRCCAEHSVEYCFQCGEYPCARCKVDEPYDSFITYRTVRRDFASAAEGGLAQYVAALGEKEHRLRFLLSHYNDGRKKSFYCLAVNLLELEDIDAVLARLAQEVPPGALTPKERAAAAAGLFNALAADRGLVLKLDRKRRT